MRFKDENVKRVASEILSSIKVGSDDIVRKLSDKELQHIFYSVFNITSVNDLKRNFIIQKGIISQDPDYGSTRKEISGLVSKEWLNQMMDRVYGEDEDIKRFEKKLMQHSYHGAGQAFSNTSVNLKDKGKQYSFVIIINSGLDI